MTAKPVPEHISDELLPCPFCGGELVITKHFKMDVYSAVHRCKIVGSMSFDFQDRARIVSSWNTRALAASPSSPASGVRVSEHVQFRLKWRAAARPPVHPEPMEGVQTFDTLAACVRFMSQQAADAEVISLTEIRSSSTDATAPLLSALGEHP